MARPKIIREEMTDESIGSNPLMNGVRIPCRRQVRGELGDDMYYQETTKFTKLYENIQYKQNMCALSVRSKEMLLYILHYLSPGKDYIYIDRKAYMSACGIKSVHTYLDAVKGLIHGKNDDSPMYIHPHAILKDVFWINPLLFFKGNRLTRFPDNLEMIKKKVEPDIEN